jgi:hypothetical protein
MNKDIIVIDADRQLQALLRLLQTHLQECLEDEPSSGERDSRAWDVLEELIAHLRTRRDRVLSQASQKRSSTAPMLHF